MYQPRRTPYTKAELRLSARKVRQYMTANVADHVDPITGEVNTTTLAEDAFDCFEKDSADDIPEKYFELAALIGERHEIKTGVREPIISRNLAGLINSLESDWF
jgi:hypothetical protein